MRMLAGAIVLLALAGCYRSAAPGQINETVRIEFTGNQGRFVRAQGYLAEELGRSLVLRNGWKVSPTGTATLSIALKQETIRVSGRTHDDIPIGQRVRLRGTALLSTRQGALSTPFSGETVIVMAVDGQGGVSFDEATALRGAAQACAAEIVEFLAVKSVGLTHPDAAVDQP